MAEPRAVLVTGATGGIGEAIARRLADGGAAIWVAGRSEARCESLAGELREGGGQAAPLVLDVADRESVAEALARVDHDAPGFGPLAGLVNNAGIAESAPALRDSEDLAQRHMEVNFHGPRRLVEGLAPAMKGMGRGSIVNLASSAGLEGYAYVSAYCASKHALVGYTRALARELDGSGVGASLVCPHYVDSPMLAASVQNLVDKTNRTEEQARAFFAAQNPGGRLVSPEDVADSVFELYRTRANDVLVELDGGPATMIQPIHPEGWAAAKGYSNGMLGRAGGRPLAIAGQIAWDAEQRLVGEGDFAAQFRQALANVVAVLDAGGGKPEHLTRLTVYVTDKKAYLDALKPIGAAWKEFVGRHYPAMALVQVADLLEEGAMVEIEADAWLVR